MEINLSYDQLNVEYSMLMSVLGASVSKHLVDDHYTCVWANDYYYDLIRYPKAQYEALFDSHCDKYFSNNPEGWAKLVGAVNSALEQGKSGYSVYLPMVYPDGEAFWIKMQAVFTDEFIDGYRVSYTTMVDVTDLMRAKLAQEETRQDFDKVLQEQAMLMSALNISVSKHLIDEHYTCVLANEYYYKLIGYSKQRYEELFHNHPDEFYRNNPEGWELLSGKVTSVLESGGDGYEAIVPMKYEDGSSYWVKLVSFFTDEYIDGYRVTYTVMTDVTELVRTRNELEMLMSAMAVSVSRHLMDEHFTVVWANEFYYRLIGYSQEEYETRFHNHCDEYFKDNEAGLKILNEKVQGMVSSDGRSYEAFLPLKLPGGSVVWAKVVGFLTDEYMDGKQIAYTTMIDVTDLMQMQKERSIAYDNIPGFIVKHRILPHGIAMIDASEQIEEIFGVSPGDLAFRDPFSVLAEESRMLIKSRIPALRRKEPLEATIHAKDKDGRDRWFHINSTCIDTISNDPVYLTMFIDITDITELRELQSKLEERTDMLNEALEAARYANAAKSDFLSRMSHDIRTPMNAITGMTEIANAHIGDQERVKDCLQKIRLSSSHLLGLINDVLDMSKIENGNFPIQMAPMVLPAELNKVIMIMMPEIRARRQRFDIYLKGLSHETFRCDALRLRQILLNLLSNASKFTREEGRLVLEVEMQNTDQADQAMLRFLVSDNGRGMKPEYLEQIFEPFTRESDSRTDRIEGSGLGMAISKRLTDLMEGDITVESRLGEGTTFQVFLPMDLLPDDPLPGDKAAGADFTDARVLLVDDDPALRDCAGQMLHSMGIQAETASFADASGFGKAAGFGEASGFGEAAGPGDASGFGEAAGFGDATGFGEAAGSGSGQRSENTDYDLIILSSGLEETKILEKAEGFCRTFHGGAPVLLSAYDVSEIKEKARAMGIRGFINKPLYGSSIMECLNRYLMGKAAARKEQESFAFTGIPVLLVEDNEINREIALELLGSYGLEFDTADNGLEAVRRFEESRPGYYALILMDIQMPVMNGYEAARAIRSLAREDAKTVPILAMTADAFVEDIESAKAAGMNGHLPKPLDFDLFGREIHKYLHR